MSKFNIAVESVSIQGQEDSGVRIAGVALPFDKISRNGFSYITESIKRAASSMQGCPVLFNHDSDKVIGHVVVTGISEEGMTYEMDLDTEGPYGWVANKVKRGDLSKVSIQALYNPEKSFISEEGVTNAWVDEFAELSVVSIPGFVDTTAQVVESLQKSKGVKMAEEEVKKEEAPVEEPKQEPSQEEQPVEAKEEQPKEEPSEPETEAKPEEPVEEPKAEESVEEPKAEESVEVAEESDKEDPMAKMEARMDAIEKQLASMNSKEGEDEESDTEEEGEEKKAEEAIKKDKLTVASEAVKQESNPEVTREDLTGVIKNLKW